MSEPPALTTLPAPVPEPAPAPPDEGWPRRKWVSVFLLVLAFHAALIFLLGTKKQPVPRPLTGVPHLRLASPTDEFAALNDPTLFARPNAHDFVSAFWRRPAPAPPPNFDTAEPPQYLNPDEIVFASGRSAGDFNTDFHALAHASPDEFDLNFKPVPEVIAPVLSGENELPQTTTLRITGELAGRRLVNTNLLDLPALRRNDVLLPSQVQVLVAPEGAVVSALVLAPTEYVTDRAADQRDLDADEEALQLARTLRFAPAPRLMLGNITFIWHTIPLTATNPP